MRVLGATEEECTDTCRDHGQLQASAPPAAAASSGRLDPRRMIVVLWLFGEMKKGKQSALVYWRDVYVV